MISALVRKSSLLCSCFRSAALAALAFIMLVSSPKPAPAQQAGTVWIEAEAPDSATSPIAPSPWAGVMSGDRWLQLSIEAGDVEKRVPEGGLVFGYDFVTSEAAVQAIWNRIGFEFVRSPFEWRIVGVSDWKTVGPDQITTDLTEIGFWAEVAWVKMGELSLPSGKHRLEIRIPRNYDAKHVIQRVLYASDALCISSTGFNPNGRFKPGDPAATSAPDREAAAKVFAVPAERTTVRTVLPLKGLWQFARYDEQLVEGRTDPIPAVPDAETLHWSSMQVPGDRNKLRPDMTFAHRYFLRTRIDVPQNGTGQSYVLHLPSVNFIATLFVNGKQIASTDLPYAIWDVDLTAALKPGINEVWLGIKDTYYALNPSDGKNPRFSFVLPTEFFNSNQGVSMQLDYPVWNHMENGILQEPSIIVSGPVYTSDVFALPSVRTHSLGLELTLHNPGTLAVEAEVSNEIIPFNGKGSAPEATFPASHVSIPPGSDSVLKLRQPWANPRLWWPDDPQQYQVRTRVIVAGKVVDERLTKFGFREWEWQGKEFQLNGIPWHGRADLAEYGKANPQAVATWKKHGQNMQRIWAETGLDGMEMEQVLDFMDANGVPIRRTGIFDGEGANYRLTENINEGGKEKTVAHRALFDHFRKQLLAWAKGQRNHPSIFIWSMENEITFINANVFGLNQYTDPEIRRTAAELAALDPTRPQMTDGGNALLDESMPVYGGHYLEADFSNYPEEAYTLAEARKSGQPGHQRWPITGQKPILMGESFFAQGNDASALAAVGGESAFVGKAESYPAMGLIGRMLSEGYRWNGQVSFHFWMGGESDLYYKSWQPIAALCREWDWRFRSAQKVQRTIGIFNDTRYADPITLEWKLILNGKTAASGSSVHAVPTGGSQKFPITIPLPSASSRMEGSLTLALLVKGSRVFEDVRPLSVLPAPSVLTSPNTTPASATSKPWLAVYDPAGTAAATLRAAGTSFLTLTSLNTLPADIKTILVGKDALSAAESGSSRLAAYAATGHCVVVLEQAHPLHYQGLPAEMAPATNHGSIAFCEDLDHPIFRGLKQADFTVWAGANNVYVDAYEKPTRGARSLIQCGNGLNSTALAEIQVGQGMLLVCQLQVESTLGTNVVAQQLLCNMASYARSYDQTFRPTALYSGGNTHLEAAVKAMGVAITKADTPLAALAKPGGIAVINATPDALKTLASSGGQLTKYYASGGWLILYGLTPEGLADFNRIVGFEHMIRPFQREKVTFPAVRSPLLAGLTAPNIVMSSGQRIFNWQAGDYPDTNAFSYVVDYEDVAPFGKSTFSAYGNIVNNFVGADGWPLIINFPVPADGRPFEVPISFPKPLTLTEFTWIGNTNYWPQTGVSLVFGPNDHQDYETRPDNTQQTFAIRQPHPTDKVTLQITKWQPQAGKGALIGIDNIYLKAKRPADYYQKVKPLLNIGALMSYPRGPGGIILCNVKFQHTEAVPENAQKKQAILSTLLHNLKAPFAGGRTLIAGAGLRYTPIDLSRSANAYRTSQGWFGDKSYTFADLPTGKHVFGGVSYNIYDFATSPVPTVVMLGGNGIAGPSEVNGIPVNGKADALFFLHTARIDARRSQNDIKENRSSEIAAYVVHYEDGTAARIPVRAELDIDDYHPQSPAPLSGAQLAWSKPYAGTQLSAAAYSMQWNNPKPDVKITTIDLISGANRNAGIPALLAISTCSIAPTDWPETNKTR